MAQSTASQSVDSFLEDRKKRVQAAEVTISKELGQAAKRRRKPVEAPLQAAPSLAVGAASGSGGPVDGGAAAGAPQ
eukprot:836132-Pyramimonas_sp.AAC.1